MNARQWLIEALASQHGDDAFREACALVGPPRTRRLPANDQEAWVEVAAYIISEERKRRGGVVPEDLPEMVAEAERLFPGKMVLGLARVRSLFWPAATRTTSDGKSTPPDATA